MKHCLPGLMLFGAISGMAMGQHRGDVPPALTWDKLKGNCPASLDWASLRGKAVVVSLESDDVFPEEIADWNKVPQKFQGEAVIFLQVVAGSEFLLDQALKKTAYQGCILLDSHFANRQNFQLPRFPRTVVVDQLGFIAGYSRGDPDEYGVRAVLNYQTETDLFETPPQAQPYDPAAGLDASPSYEIHISPAQRDTPRALASGGPNRYIAKNYSLKVIISDLWSTPYEPCVIPRGAGGRGLRCNGLHTGRRQRAVARSRSRSYREAVRAADRKRSADAAHLLADNHSEFFISTTAS